jgi:hypothetical protein
LAPIIINYRRFAPPKYISLQVLSCRCDPDQQVYHSVFATLNTSFHIVVLLALHASHLVLCRFAPCRFAPTPCFALRTTIRYAHIRLLVAALLCHSLCSFDCLSLVRLLVPRCAKYCSYTRCARTLLLLRSIAVALSLRIFTTFIFARSLFAALIVHYMYRYLAALVHYCLFAALICCSYIAALYISHHIRSACSYSALTCSAVLINRYAHINYVGRSLLAALVFAMSLRSLLHRCAHHLFAALTHQVRSVFAALITSLTCALSCYALLSRRYVAALMRLD